MGGWMGICMDLWMDGFMGGWIAGIFLRGYVVVNVGTTILNLSFPHNHRPSGHSFVRHRSTALKEPERT